MRLPHCTAAVLGIDLSPEMLRHETWTEVATERAPAAGERLQCDLAQPLPFRAGVFDVAYSVAAVHYLAQDSEHRSRSERLSSFLSSLRRCMASSARPCTLQAFFSKEP